mmetsp:Transcript_98307/g.262718  ORF Transcript_98307/g.262718 Transcript_98307/m.262718 type:complete len:387 (-) Transcript_98307:24-1184(-)
MSSVVRLRGLPFETNEAELINFFTPLPVVSAVITYDLSGRPSGEGFVTFADPGAAAGALAYNRQHLGRRYVEVFESTPQEMASKTNQGYQAAHAQQTDGVVRMRGLPFDCTPQQVVEFFAGFSITEHNVTLGIVADGKFQGQASGEGWVQFPSQELAAAALHSKNKQMIGGRYVELFPSTAADREISRLKSGTKPGAGATGGGMGAMGAMGGMFDPGFGDPSALMAAAAPAAAFGGGGAVVRMRGLPYSCTPHDVVQFFAPEFELGIDQISLPAGADGRPSGQGTVTFADRDEAARAIASKNRQYLGSRYVELSEEGGYGGFGGGAARGPPPAAKRAAPYDAYDPAGAGGWGADPWAAAAADPAMMGMLMQMMTMMKGGGKGMDYM